MDPTHDVRPRLRADALFTATDDGVLLQYPEGRFVLKGRTAYRWMCRLAPHLTGAHTLAELCHGLPEERRATVTAMVRTLLARGVAQDVRPEEVPSGQGSSRLPEAVRDRFADQLGYLDHRLGGGATAAFARFRATRVLIAGHGPVAESCGVTLLRNGLRTVALTGPYQQPPRQLLLERAALRDARCEAEVEVVAAEEDGGRPGEVAAAADVVVACGTGYGELARRNRAALDGGPALLPLTVLDGSAVLGPLVHGRGDDGGSGDGGAGGGGNGDEGNGGGRQVAGCWQCAVLRLAANLEPTDAAALLRAVHTGRSATGPATQLGRMLGTMLAFEVFRYRTGALPAECTGALVLQDRTTLATSRETLLAHPDCAACGPAPRTARGGAGPRTASGVRDGADPAGEGVLFGAYAGVFRRYADDALPQSPVRAARIEVAAPGPSAVRPRSVTAFALGTQADARTTARYSAALVYERLLHAHGLPRSAAPYLADGAVERVPGAELSNWSGIRDSGDTDGAGGASAPGGADERAAEGPWLRAWEWEPTQGAAPGHGRTVAVPAAAVHPGGALDPDGRFEPGGAGAGAGATLDAAARRGLLSALAREGVVAALRAQAAPRVLPAPSGDAAAEDDCGFLFRAAAHLDRQVTLLELPGAAPAHAVVALAGDGPTAHAAEALGYGTTRAEAVAHALRDLVGTLQLAAHGHRIDLGDPLVPGIDAPALLAAAEPAAEPAAEAAAAEEPTAGKHLSGRMPAERGQEALVVLTTPPDLRAGGVETVRVLLRRPREAPA
ncbi:TOMM precursor leader peptide-binding protein [Streptomyces sp. NPDC053499]|uniref:TOMM precursor leader peptide-binding protein n=1 Tax=Streptomyces sp. NPDC053499 TaxID=3365707 RepID=UPI0037D46B0F